MKKNTIAILTILFCLLLFGCAPQQVEGKTAKVILNGVTTECKYTGSYQFKPVGEGTYSFTTGDDIWTFTGALNKDNSLTNGSVENMPCTLKNNGKRYETYYTGEVINLLPQSEIPITDFAFMLEYDGNGMQGIYNGTILNDLPDGQGSFSYENKGEYFEYTGAWLAGKPTGEGRIESNCFVVHFDDVDREGEYKGSVVNGVPCGKGTFSAVNGEGVSYKYDGEWLNGLYNGAGRLVYNSDDYWTLDGDFEEGDFTPSVADLYLAQSTEKESEFQISKVEYDFISSHEDMFSGKLQEIDNAFIDANFKYENFSKNSSQYEKSIIRVNNLRVVQVFDNESYGYKTVFMIAEDSRYRVYYINMIGSAPDVVEGSRIQLTALPLDYFTYPNVENTKIWAIACIGIIITKQ